MNSMIHLALLGEMLGREPDQLPVRARDQRNVKAASSIEYERAMDQYVMTEEHAFDELKEELAQKDLLSQHELKDPSVVPDLSIIVSDSRSEKTFPFKELMFRMSNVVLSDEPQGAPFQ